MPGRSRRARRRGGAGAERSTGRMRGQRVVPPTTIGHHGRAGHAPRGRHAPPLEVRQDRQRARLFAAASAVFARNGFADATAEAIAREAGMSKATFYEHFGNKEECILALFDAAIDASSRRIAQAAASTAATRRRAASAPRCARSSGSSTPSPTRRRRCWWRSSAPARAPRSAATPRSRASPTASTRPTASTPRPGSSAARLAARRVRDRRRDRRARLAPDPHRGPGDIGELEPVLERLILGLVGAAPPRASAA